MTNTTADLTADNLVINRIRDYYSASRTAVEDRNWDAAQVALNTANEIRLTASRRAYDATRYDVILSTAMIKG